MGTVWIGLCDTTGDQPMVTAHRFHFPGDRDWVRDRTVKSAFQLLRLRLLDVDAPLLWAAER